MDITTIERFTALWQKYFNHAEFPITFYYTGEVGHAELAKPNAPFRCAVGALAVVREGTSLSCIIGALTRVREGTSLSFNANSIGCFGGKRYLGFRKNIMPGFNHFLSCGVIGVYEGERYKKSPELVEEMFSHAPAFEAPGRFIVFKRWDKLEESDNPEVVIFFARPDVMSGLFTLANFDEAEPNGVFAPFASGCGSIVYYPYLESLSQHPRGVIGMFDVSARPFVPEDMLTFSVPMNKFSRMIDNMEESFLITNSWKKIQKRIS